MGTVEIGNMGAIDLLTYIPMLVYVVLIIFYFKFLKPFENKITTLEKKILILETKSGEVKEIKTEIHLLRKEINDIKNILIKNNKE